MSLINLMLTQDELKKPFGGTRIETDDVHASMSLLNTGFLKVGQAVFDKSQEERAPSSPITGMNDTNGYIPVQTGALKRSSLSIRRVFLSRSQTIPLLLYFLICEVLELGGKEE